MSTEHVAVVDWHRQEWRVSVTGTGLFVGCYTAIEGMAKADDYCGGLRWEAAGSHTFHGYATEPTIAPATVDVIDPADDPTPDDAGDEPPSAEHAFTTLREEGDGVRRCTEPGCRRPHQARGLCNVCYARHKTAGTLPPLGTKPRTSGEPPVTRDRFIAPKPPPPKRTHVTAESLGFPAGAPIRWPKDWADTPEAELARIAAAALARCGNDRREARKYLGCGQVQFDAAVRTAERLGLA